MGCSQSKPSKEILKDNIEIDVSKLVFRRKSVYFAGVTEDDEFLPKFVSKSPEQIEFIREYL